MNADQRTAAMSLLSAVLSRRGFEKVQQIMEGDEALKTNPGNGRGGGPPAGRKGDGAPPDAGRKGPPPGGGAGRGGGAMFGKDLYYISILGTP